MKKFLETTLEIPTIAVFQGINKIIGLKGDIEETEFVIDEGNLIVAKGNFSMIQKADDLLCKDYKDIMEQNEVIALKGKKAEKYDNEPALEEIRRLQQFE